MVYFHEIIGPILAMVAVILTILLFKKTIDFQAYRELDSNYMEVPENSHRASMSFAEEIFGDEFRRTEDI